ncbi:ankyrin repeat-containing domain protein [Aspergillus karnatakaensis]|uniref:ankyrin repeat domain-containing protein n=1 Tax=Aspergillus karnatakaensis TaxID=1810916 RepID=UPI003CCD0F70
MSLLLLPRELHLMIANNLESEADLNAYCQASKCLYPLLSEHLYKNNTKNHKSSALFFAAKVNNVKVAKRAIASGADVNTEDVKLVTPLVQAAVHVHIEVAVVLLEHDADVHAMEPAVPFNGYATGPPLLEASKHNHIAMIRLLLDNGAQVDYFGGLSGNALEAAAYHGNNAAVQVLLEEGANIEIDGHYGSPLIAAVYGSHLEVIRTLLRNGANLQAELVDHGTPLQAAAKAGDLAIVRLLLERNADVNALGGCYGTALRAAQVVYHYTGEEVYLRIAELLLEYGADNSDPFVPWL